MGILNHSHKVARGKTSSSPHVDSVGRAFGGDVHQKLADSYEWVEDPRPEMDKLMSPQISMEELPHSHKYMKEARDKDTKAVIWTYEPPDAREAEREIGKVPVGAVVRPSEIEEEDKPFVD